LDINMDEATGSALETIQRHSEASSSLPPLLKDEQVEATPTPEIVFVSDWREYSISLSFTKCFSPSNILSSIALRSAYLVCTGAARHTVHLQGEKEAIKLSKESDSVLTYRLLCWVPY